MVINKLISREAQGCDTSTHRRWRRRRRASPALGVFTLGLVALGSGRVGLRISPRPADAAYSALRMRPGEPGLPGLLSLLHGTAELEVAKDHHVWPECTVYTEAGGAVQGSRQPVRLASGRPAQHHGPRLVLPPPRQCRRWPPPCSPRTSIWGCRALTRPRCRPAS